MRAEGPSLRPSATSSPSARSIDRRRGSFDFYFRTRATTPGRFIQPPALAEMMYDGAIRGSSAGTRVVIERKE